MVGTVMLGQGGAAGAAGAAGTSAGGGGAGGGLNAVIDQAQVCLPQTIDCPTKLGRAIWRCSARRCSARREMRIFGLTRFFPRHTPLSVFDHRWSRGRA